MLAFLGWAVMVLILVAIVAGTIVIMVVQRGFTGDSGWKIGVPVLCACAYGLYSLMQVAPFTVSLN